ncbi:hypothetical protein G8S49_01370 [Clostridium botulinum C]|uniref:Uncharacterized protein n=1 Tax=Clostridium botulinum C TaxID=36828 RepID=A0A9Q3V8E7_CLOBO|nr:hypothetical protein [Clostridium botulinum]MCD3194226.1 hypothetical protein [Clostridium botulinum C]MCD3199145.1 hypothetical protein [Clostridium botulinum C]MCD3204620.1 hypothetical protein [Clostridium botulinum C]MCD3207963.1 hypothetical protein [Clostridium botulinum C]MCD3225097.1 hypothetical protein [Clostridium botulinum C]
MTNKEKALLTYEILQKRKKIKAKKAEQDFLAYAAANIDRIYKKNYPGRRRRGEF